MTIDLSRTRYRFHIYDGVELVDGYDPESRFGLTMCDETDRFHRGDLDISEAEWRYHAERGTLTKMLREYRAKLKADAEREPGPEQLRLEAP